MSLTMTYGLTSSSSVLRGDNAGRSVFELVVRLVDGAAADGAISSRLQRRKEEGEIGSADVFRFKEEEGRIYWTE